MLPAISIQVSDDDSAYTDVYSTTTGQGRNEVITLDTPVTGRYVRLSAPRRRPILGTAFRSYEFEIYNFTDEEMVDERHCRDCVPAIVNHDFTLPVGTDEGVKISWTCDSDLLAIDAETGAVTVTAPEGAPTSP